MSDTSRLRERMLLVAPSFFGYEKDIIAEFEENGYESTFLDERPSNSAITRAVLRLRPGVLRSSTNRYYRRRLLEVAGCSFDLVVVVKAEVVPRWFLAALREANPGAEFVFYTFDSLSNSNNCLEVLDLFDRRLSFDRHDVEQRDDFDYLPLFYTPEFSQSTGHRGRRYQLTFIGTLHSDRHRLVARLVAGMDEAFCFFFVQARWYFALVKYVTREHRGVKWREVSFRSLSRHDMADLFGNSRAVIDIQRSGQSGLTMRTFEVLASGAILVTTNDAIRLEPFFDPNRVIIIPGEASEVRPEKVLATLDALPQLAGPPEGFERYSLRSWVRKLAGLGVTA